jgi:hypothetical protein
MMLTSMPTEVAVMSYNIIQATPILSINPDVVELKENQKPKKKKLKTNQQPSLPEQIGQPASLGDVFTNDFSLPVAAKDIPIAIETKKEVKPEVKKSKMKKWPENQSELLSYNEIAEPLKDILKRGYRLFRKDEVKEFDYEGYNIGKHELQTHPTPRARLSEKCLIHEKSLGHSLMDVVLNVMFLLGVEQGRRAERRDANSIDELLGTLEAYRKRNKDQRIRIDELEVILDVKNLYLNLSEEEFKKKVQDGISERRSIRIEELKSELQLDASRSSFQFKTPARTKFKELEKLAKTLTKETCSSDQWKDILKERGWTFDEWKKRCKKKIIQTFFF